jgi:hypothetical protein
MLIDEKAKDSPNQEFVFEVSAGVNFITGEFGTEMTALQNLTKEGQITWPLLWMLFPPNVVAVAQDELEQTFALIVRSTWEEEDMYRIKHLMLRVDHVDHNGKDLVMRTRWKWDIPFFEGTMELTDLLLLPLQRHPDRENIRQRLLHTWQTAANYHGVRHAAYQGHALRTTRSDRTADSDKRSKNDDGPNPNIVKFNSHGRVMLDPVSLLQTQPESGLRPGKFRPLRRGELNDDLRLTMSPKLYGFSLGDKTWGE